MGCHKGIVPAILIRTLYFCHIAAMIGLALLMYDSLMSFSRQWFIGLGLVFLIGEAIFTFVQTGGWDWKWGTPSVLVYTASVAACVYYMELKVTEFHAEGVTACTHLSLQAEFTSLNVLQDWVYFCKCGHCNMAMEQVFLICLVLGRWLLPHGKAEYVYKEQVFDRIMQHVFKSQLIMLIACNAADSLDMVNYVREPDVKENTSAVTYIMYVWILSLTQFSVVTTATKAEKSGEIILLETDMWSSIIIMLIHDLPFFIVRLYIIVSYHLLSPTGIFFLAKNLFSIMAAILKTRMLCKVRDDERIQTLFADSRAIELGERLEQERLRKEAEEEAALRGELPPPMYAPKGMSRAGAYPLPEKRPLSAASWMQRKVGSVLSLGQIKGEIRTVDLPPPVEKKPRPPLQLRKGPRLFTDVFAEKREDSFMEERKKPVGTKKFLTTSLGELRVMGKLAGMDDSSDEDADNDSDQEITYCR